jgi:hypothetical protein
MCFYIHQDHIDAKIAENDITCYKILTRKKNKDLVSPYIGSEVILGEKVEQKLERYGFSIDIGIHSCSTFLSAVKRRFEMWAGTHCCEPGKKIIIKCIIPKGTKYYYNPEDKEYVSEAMIYGNKRYFLIRG